MANIKTIIDYPIADGSEITFRSPLDNHNITGLTVCYPDADGNETSKNFTFVDAHRNDVTQLSNLFTQGAIVKVILDYTNGLAFIQNADTNAYLEGKFSRVLFIKGEGEDGEEVELLPAPIYEDQKGAPGGVATLDENGKVPVEMIPDGIASEEFVTNKINEIPTPDVSGQINTHNENPESHTDIRSQIIDLINRLNLLANSDDTTLDQMAEVVAYIKSNKTLIDSITTSKVSVIDIIDNLTTNVTNKPLSAAQGVVLKSLIESIIIPTKPEDIGAMPENSSWGDPNTIFANPTKDQWGLKHVCYDSKESCEIGLPPLYVLEGYFGSQQYNVLTFGYPTRLTQIAIQVFRNNIQNRVFIRGRHVDNNDMSEWQQWMEIPTIDNVVKKSGDTMNGFLSIKVHDTTTQVIQHQTKAIFRNSSIIDYKYTQLMLPTVDEFNSGDQPMFMVRNSKDESEIIHRLHHTGNVPSGSYTGNGDSTERIIEIGGLNSNGGLLINSTHGIMAIVTPHGTIYKLGDQTVVNGLSYTNGTFGSGVLRILTNHPALNANGVEYYYTTL